MNLGVHLRYRQNCELSISQNGQILRVILVLLIFSVRIFDLRSSSTFRAAGQIGQKPLSPSQTVLGDVE